MRGAYADHYMRCMQRNAYGVAVRGERDLVISTRFCELSNFFC